MTTAGKDTADTGNEDWGPQRSRTVVWHDPGPGVARGLTMAGIDYLKAIIAGELPPPPITVLMQFDLVDAEPGKVVFTCQPDGSVYNPNGGVHGGLVCTLLDSVAGLALHSTLPAGKGYTSIEIKVNYLKAVRLETGRLTATGTVVKSGSRVGFTEGVVIDGSGKLVATATSTCWCSTCSFPASQTPDGGGGPKPNHRRQFAIVGQPRRPQTGHAPMPCECSTFSATRICSSRLAPFAEPEPPLARQVLGVNCRPPE
jgi:uncharacterized protein (TIGR00369 family)